jgi:hypothetical protein
VKDDQPQATGAPEIRRRSIGNGRAEGDVALPLRWKNFTGGNKAGVVLLQITLEQRDGIWRPTAAKNLNNP